jgi:hypothetical protein
MEEDEIARRLTEIDQLMNQLIFALMKAGMSYRQAEEEMFRRLKRRRWDQHNGHVMGQAN